MTHGKVIALLSISNPSQFWPLLEYDILREASAAPRCLSVIVNGPTQHNYGTITLFSALACPALYRPALSPSLTALATEPLSLALPAQPSWPAMKLLRSSSA